MLGPPIARIKDPEAHHAGTHLSAAWNCLSVLSVSKSMRLPGKRIDFETESTEKQFHAADNCVPAWWASGSLIRAIGGPSICGMSGVFGDLFTRHV